MKSREEPEYLTPKEAADFLRVSQPTIRRWYNEGKLKGRRLAVGTGRLIRFKMKDLVKFAESGIGK